MQAIETRFHGPTDTRGARITATCMNGRISVPYDHARDSGDNHRIACDALLVKLDWRGRWVGGSTRRGYAFVRDMSAPTSPTVVERF